MEYLSSPKHSNIPRFLWDTCNVPLKTAADFIVFFAAATVAPKTTRAADFIFGDEKGWTTFFDQTWADGKDFRIGDRLIFNYPAGQHNVFKVNETEYMNCDVPAPNLALTSGHDIIDLATPGKKWYLCGIGLHCARTGQKLAIAVVGNGNGAPALAPAPFF